MSPRTSHILLVEDDEKIRGALLFQLRSAGFTVEMLAAAEEALERLTAADPPDLLLLDIRLPGMSGIELIRKLAGPGRLPPTVIISGEASITETVEALRLGVHDFIEKPFTRERLLQSVRNALETSTLKRRLATLESRLDDRDEMLGSSPLMTQLRKEIARAASTDARVLVRGPSGSGKELVANALHGKSDRRDGPFVKVNCAALPGSLVESELFGHARGAFTDAKVARAGLFEEADGGTLLLDEIGDMEAALQGRLLRVLEDGRVRRIGETRGRNVDVRVIAATHRDLEAEVQAGRFRQDLYFRLAHVPIRVPSLAERSEDVRPLFLHWLERLAVRYRLRRKRVDEAVFPLLERYGWPGNVRELRNLCERLTVLGADPITPDQLPPAFFQEESPIETGMLRLYELQRILPWKRFKAESEREYLETVLQRTGWNFSEAARLLDMQRTYLHQKAAALGIERPSPDSRR